MKLTVRFEELEDGFPVFVMNVFRPDVGLLGTLLGVGFLDDQPIENPFGAQRRANKPGPIL